MEAVSHNSYKDETYFWYSQKQKEHLNNNGDDAMRYAIIDGEEVLYTMCAEHKNGGPAWKDTKFLGCGKISRIESLAAPCSAPGG